MTAVRIDEAFARQMLDHLPNTAVVMFGTDLVYTLVGGGLLRELGVQPDAVEGTSVPIELDADGHSRAYDACVAALRGSTSTFELKTVQDRSLECTAVPVLENGDIVGGLLISRDVSVRKRNELQLQAFARTDALTGVANRLRFQLALRRAMQGSAPLALLVLDLNGFKLVNDSRGHQEGDRCLRAAALAIEESTRPGDTVARIGGDRFAVILPGASSEAAMAVAQRIRSAVSLLPYAVKISVGVSLFPRDATDSYWLQKKADEAMHADKHVEFLPACEPLPALHYEPR
jgi:diguanylate cyclase (GGDEF)-like protein